MAYFGPLCALLAALEFVFEWRLKSFEARFGIFGQIFGWPPLGGPWVRARGLVGARAWARLDGSWAMGFLLSPKEYRRMSHLRTHFSEKAS